MFSISFLHKILVISTIFTTILISFSTAWNPFEDSNFSKKDKLIRMIPKKNKFEYYPTYFEYTIAPLKEDEKLMGIDDYYNSIYGRESIRIPGPSKIFDYNAYSNFVNNFCYKEFISMLHFRWLHYVSIAKYSLLFLKNCLQRNVLTIKRSNGVKTADETLKTKMIQALSWEPAQTDYNCSDELREYMITMNKCLRDNYSKAHDNTPTFVNCFSLTLTKRNHDNWMGYYYNKNSSLKYSKIFLENIREILSLENKVEPFNKCFYSFKDIMWPAYPGRRGNHLFRSTDVYLLEMYILLSLLYHYNYELDYIDTNEFYQRLVAEKEYTTPKNSEIRDYCKKNIKLLDLDDYSYIMAAYATLPNPLDSKTYSAFKKIKHERLKNDSTYSKFYNEFNQSMANITEEDFKQMVKRRPIKNEKYYKYAARIHLRGYLPLPESLWRKEMAFSHKKATKKMTDKEFTEDLKNHES